MVNSHSGTSESVSLKATLLQAKDIEFHIVTSSGLFPIIKNVNVSITRGEIVGILGPNGCGKTTLLRILAELIVPSKGSVQYYAQSPKIGMVFQDVQNNLVPWKTCLSNVALPAIIAKKDRASTKAKAGIVLRAMGLEDIIVRYPCEVSGGQQQLISLARWLVNPPSILFVDEGWAMLDLVQRQRAYGILLNLATQGGCTICVVSHNISELAGVANRVLVLTMRPAEIATEVVFDEKTSPIQRSDCLWKAAKNIFDTSALAPLP